MLTFYEVNDTVIVDCPTSAFDGFIGEIVELNRLNCKVKLRGKDNFFVTFPYDVLDRINNKSEPEGLDVTGKRKAQRDFVKQQKKWDDTWCSYQTGKATKEALANGVWHKENFRPSWLKIAFAILAVIASFVATIKVSLLALPIGLALTVAIIWLTRPRALYDYVSKHNEV